MMKLGVKSGSSILVLACVCSAGENSFFDRTPAGDGNRQQSVSQSGSGLIGPDVTLCQLYQLAQWGREGNIIGCGIATTSWNIGDQRLDWYETPDNRHPFIAQNVYRLHNDRFEQIGQSWLKHGFFALSHTQCGGTCTSTNGTQLGIGCTDTYGSSLNASLLPRRLGPRYEVNPWTGLWTYSGSTFDPAGEYHPELSNISKRVQIHEADLGIPGAQYFMEAYYVQHQDVNHMNSAAWKPVTPDPPNPPSTTWSFQSTSAASSPNIGFAIDAWTGAMQTVVAMELPIVEGVSPDGRCILSSKVINEAGNVWRYEYALLNVDMDRQVGSFTVPLGPGIQVLDSGFSAVRHHDEPWNTVDADRVEISNDPWAIAIDPESISWSTLDNPLRFGTLYNFWFTADTEPDPDNVEATVGLFRVAARSILPAVTFGPLATPIDCPGDADGNSVVDVNDISFVVLRLGTSGEPGSTDGDVDGTGTVDVGDITFIVFRLGTCM